jgi:hypothetical protein
MSIIDPPANTSRTPPHAGETPEQRYARQTRTAVVFIAWVVAVVVVLTLIFGIIAGVQLGKIQNELNNGGSTTNSDCLSQGGTNPNC